MTTQLIQPTSTLHKEAKVEKRISLTKIMVLTDFSKVSDLALQYAVALARQFDARIYLTHIVTRDSYQLAPVLAEISYQKMCQAAEQGKADTLLSGTLLGIPHEVLLLEGSLWPTVERLIQECKIDLVVTGTHGRGQLKKMILGSVAEEVFRQADCPVLTVGPHAEAQVARAPGLENILLATDFGPSAERAAQCAFSLAQEYGARLTVLHVVEDVRAYTEEEEERVREVNIHEMSQFMPPESESWCNVKFRVAFGSAVEEILGAAGEAKTNLIIMGAQTRKTFAGHMPLTIAYNVAAKAECPVLTVRGGSA